MVELLVQNGACANETLNHSNSVIFNAIRKNAVDIVRLISGAEGHDWTVTDRKGKGVLQVAATLARSDMVQYLLSLLNEPDGRYEFSTDGALHLAIACKRHHSARLLMRSAHVDRKLLLDSHLGDGKLLYPESTPIYEACCRGPLDIVRYLVEQEYWTIPLPDLCVFFAAVNGQQDILEYLLGCAATRAEMDWLLLKAVERASDDDHFQCSGYAAAKLCIGLADLPNSTRQAEWLGAIRDKGWPDLEDLVEWGCQELDLQQKTLG
ncbi:Ankyrin repeat-containing domain protein [Cordyceps fumosorosea ARSEF 2679]|uniref:Ankyrin repeat-containing domain protein n=1 Tax=Cordyceps fumosorosea (strain ARSEF 2679) TaxID=1081104 RepID=A0A162MAA4_CORFA|nr:Ankyrin repeat-containing domain protein [Cordyceps fumosorosea ARSEF 2679]OAA53280.1 Ankyrin repeat-containing domain protein [Cordyceps fumosorosea ARSEF 2679]